MSEKISEDQVCALFKYIEQRILDTEKAMNSPNKVPMNSDYWEGMNMAYSAVSGRMLVLFPELLKGQIETIRGNNGTDES